jgi:hypothetical protein
MYGLIIHTETLAQIFSVETWFVISVILAPVGYVVQDVVADAMTVEAVPLSDESGNDYSKIKSRSCIQRCKLLDVLQLLGALF